MNNFSITKNGKALDKSKYTIDLTNKTFYSTEYHLVLDFNCFGWTFKTGHNCIFTTGGGCTFNTDSHCTFKTYGGCTFHTAYACTFNTWDDCTFTTGNGCTFTTGGRCTFNTGKGCVFMCNVNTCKFKSFDGISIILNRYDNKRYVLDKDFIQLQKVLNG